MITKWDKFLENYRGYEELDMGIESVLKQYLPYVLHPDNIDTNTGRSKLPMIYRGLRSESDFLLVDPKSYKRKSAYTNNYYTEIIDNTWEGFPKRSNSIICSTGQRLAESYGNGSSYRVFPLDETAMFAVAPERDIWYSFDLSVLKRRPFNLLSTAYMTSLKHYNNWIGKWFMLEDDESFESLKSKMTVDRFVQYIKNELSIKVSSEDIRRELDEVADENGSLFNYLNIFKSDNFEMRTFRDMIVESRSQLGDHETWTDAKCLLIDNRIFDDYMSRYYEPLTDTVGWKIVNGKSTNPKLTDDEKVQAYLKAKNKRR